MTPLNLYLLAKAYLHLRGLMRVDLASNLLLMILALVPLPRRYARAQAGAVALLAVGLLWREWPRPWILPPGASVGFEIAAAAFVSAGGFFAWRRRLRLTLPALAALALVGIYNLESVTVGRAVARIYAMEAERRTLLPAVEKPPFDVVILQVGSLSWDDLSAAGTDGRRVLSRFDWLLPDFNTVASYGAPSALRLLRSTCGQARHDDLYRAWPTGCSLLEALRARGYRTFIAMNHLEGESGLARELAEYARADAPIDLKGLAPRGTNFDDRPLWGDADVLRRAWQRRLASGGARAVLYYNSATLHAGAHDAKAGWARSREERYRASLERLGADLDSFYALLRASGRDVVVFFVPEHGLPLREDTRLSADLRDAPLPQVTLAPMGVKFIGPHALTARAQQRVRTPVSYSAVGVLTAGFLGRPPFGREGERAAALFGELPASAFLGENQRARVARVGDEFFLYGKEKKWIKIQRDIVHFSTAGGGGS